MISYALLATAVLYVLLAGVAVTSLASITTTRLGKFVAYSVGIVIATLSVGTAIQLFLTELAGT